MSNRHQQIVDLEVSVAPADVLRMMGVTKGAAARPDHLELIHRLLAETEPLIRARGIYVVHPVARMTDTELVLEGCHPIRGPIAGFLRPSQRVAAFVVTIGDAIERLADQRMREASRLEGYTLNSIGSAAADSAVDALADSLYFQNASPDEALTPPFSPGYCGLPLDEQIALFAMLDPKPIGVRLLPTMIMQPIKSVSGLIGIGPADQVEAHGIPCEWCDLKTCSMRRDTTHLPRSRGAAQD